jgi:hypothetical protein
MIPDRLLERLGKGEAITIPADVQISVPIQMVPGLINTLTFMNDEYNKTLPKTTGITEVKSNV